RIGERRVPLAANRQQERVHPGGIDGVNCLQARNEGRDNRASELVDELAKDGVFLRGAADDGEGPDRPGAMENTLDSQTGEFVSQAVIAEMIAERGFRERAIRLDSAGDAKVGLGVDGEPIEYDVSKNAITIGVEYRLRRWHTTP